jgi:hypothetical protein
MYEASSVSMGMRTTDRVAQRGGRSAIEVETGLRAPTSVLPKLVLPIRASKPAVKPQQQRMR